MISHIHNSVIVCLLTVIAVGLASFIPTAHAETPLHFGWSAVTPHAADFGGDGYHDLGIYDAETGQASVRQINGETLASDTTIGLSGYLPAFGDYDGDYLSDPASYDSASGIWYAFLSGRFYQLSVFQGLVGPSTTEVKPADYDGDGKVDPALYDSSSGAWLIYASASGYQPYSFILGGNGATAVPADYDGDGKIDPAVYDQNTGLWGVLCSASQYAYTWVVYGGPGCEAAPADFDGDRKADPTIYSAALGVWGTLHSSSNYTPNIVVQGGPDCMPVPGNYYFTNRADYALYNTTNYGWYVAYHPLGADEGFSWTWAFKSLAGGAISEIGSQIMGWGLKKIFHHGEDPADARWAEEQRVLSEMNGKLDQLLTGQQVITNMLWQLSQQLEYDKTEIELLIRQVLADQAFVTIQTYYDQHGTDGYASFYQCDTNNTPSCAEVDHFVSVIQTHNIKESVSAIYRTILPAAGNANGVLRLWAAMAKPRITPDNLLDHYQSLFYYFATLYNYQMKGACLYVDTERVHGTSVWAKASVATYITNDLANMVRAEVDEFQAITYEYVMTAINASYNPGSTNNPLLVANMAETLAALEFFTRQLLGEDEHICATFLTTDWPDKLAKYNGVFMRGWSNSHDWVDITGSTVTNWVTGRPYGYFNASSNQLLVSDRYAFLRCDFGPKLEGISDYAVFTSQGSAGGITVSNYDDFMHPTNSATITNWFGHLYASPVNIVDWYTLPLGIGHWPSILAAVAYYGCKPDYRDIWYAFNSPTSLTNFDMYVLLTYDEWAGHNLPCALGVWPWYHVFGYPISISNHAGRAVNARACLTVEDSSTTITRRDGSLHHYTDQYWRYQNCSGLCLVDDTVRYDSWVDLEGGGAHKHKAGNIFDETHTSVSNYHQGMTYHSVSGTTNLTTIYVGAHISLYQDCYQGESQFGRNYCYADARIRFKVKQIIVSFY